MSTVTFEPELEEKRWRREFEDRVRRWWDEEELYSFDVEADREVFVVDTPPPYPSGRPWHVGAAAQYSQIDMIARTARMLDYEVYFPIGIDRNGLPVETYTEEKYGVEMRETPREEFIDLCSEALDELEEEMLGIMKSMGMSGDFGGHYRTDSVEYRRFTQRTFIELWNQGLIYQDTRPNNYCPDCGTTIADAEVTYEEKDVSLAYVKFQDSASEEDVVIATTRPELLCACRLVIFNPDDERYQGVSGEELRVPLYGQKVPVREHHLAKTEFGTGLMMVCSYGDFTDVQLFRELGLDEVLAVGDDGRMTEAAGPYEGLTVEEARSQIIEDLRDEGSLDKVERTSHRTPRCERCGTEIEIIPMEEYYLKQLDFLDQLRELAHETTFYPDRHRSILLDWMDSLSIDWPISRRRYYGTELPIWYCESCGEPHVPEGGEYYQPWRDDPPFDECESCGGTEFRGEERTLDTWMDSSVSALFLSGYGRDEGRHERMYPAGVRPQGKDIIRTWLYYSFLRCYQLTGEVAWNQVWVAGLGMDEEGKAMSKSKGNVMDPVPLLREWGADNFRFWNASEASHGSNFRCSERRVEEASHFLTKLWNVSRFISFFPVPEVEVELVESDRWIFEELAETVERALEGYEGFDFFVPSNAVREFVWNTFAPHYMEMVKPRAYGRGFSEAQQRAAWRSLHEVLKTLLLLLAPITPHFTDYVWRRLYGEGSIHREVFPEPPERTEFGELTEELKEFNSTVWSEKKSEGMSLRDEIGMEVPERLSAFREDLVAMHNLT